MGIAVQKHHSAAATAAVGTKSATRARARHGATRQKVASVFLDSTASLDAAMNVSIRAAQSLLSVMDGTAAVKVKNATLRGVVWCRAVLFLANHPRCVARAFASSRAVAAVTLGKVLGKVAVAAAQPRAAPAPLYKLVRVGAHLPPGSA